MVPELYRVPVSRRGGVGTPETLELIGPASEFVDDEFNLNGIDATRDGKTLIVVNSTRGELYTVDAADGRQCRHRSRWWGGANGRRDPASWAHAVRAAERRRDGRAQPDRGDPVEQRPDLGPDRRHPDSPLFETATTLAKRGSLFVAVNAQFGGSPIDPEAEVVLLRIR